MTPESIAEEIDQQLSISISKNLETIEYIYSYPGPLNYALFGEVTKLLIVRFRSRGRKNVEIGRISSRNGCTYVSFLVT